uniref:Uncharacterized protein n=1 Tax=Arundo donax TaxID=35708 RepID=A0A0A9BXF8_ARUDO
MQCTQSKHEHAIQSSTSFTLVVACSYIYFKIFNTINFLI